MNDVIILAIETSCDETAVSVVKNGNTVLSSLVLSQIDIHKKFGGVVPEVASRHHVESISPLIEKAIKEADIDYDDLSAVAVTKGPGLVGALLVGVSIAKAFAYSINKPLIGVNHIKGHVLSNFIAYPNLKPPFICLIVSGGHTHIVHANTYTDYQIIGKTRDDACGEAFDKVARVLGLGYPGGPKIDNIAKEGNENFIDFPKVSFDDNEFDFSFSGLKTSVINHLHKLDQNNVKYDKKDIAASFQKAAVSVLVEKSVNAAIKFSSDKLVIAGGVSANSYLRKEFEKECLNKGIKLYIPPIELCTDNASMIGAIAYFQYLNNDFSDLDMNANPSLKIYH